MRDNPVCYLHGMQFRKLFPTSFLVRDLGITYVWWYVIFSAVILYSKIIVQAVMMKRKAALAQESYCGISERHKNGCVDECSKPKALTRQCEYDENAQRWQFQCWQQHIFHLRLSMCRRYSFYFKRSVANCLSTQLANRGFNCAIIMRYNNKILFLPETAQLVHWLATDCTKIDFRQEQQHLLQTSTLGLAQQSIQTPV